ncbi:MAG: hypothetical protein DRP82_05400 [Planctomycetota bacterium]|nr:MAG: hypothetical protein DRP82_05400 [Planctomycetota bacterium]
MAHSDDPTISNTIFWNNSATNDGNQYRFVQPMNLYYCYSNNSGDVAGSGAFNPVACVTADPQFADPDGPDNIAGNADDDYHLQNTSLCIDAGENSFAQWRNGRFGDGNPRIADRDDPPDGVATVGIGAYEHQL